MEMVHKSSWCTVRAKRVAGRVKILGLEPGVLAKKPKACVLGFEPSDKCHCSLGLCSSMMQEPSEKLGPHPGD